jgi:hypothetical protein
MSAETDKMECNKSGDNPLECNDKGHSVSHNNDYSYHPRTAPSREEKEKQRERKPETIKLHQKRRSAEDGRLSITSNVN